MCASSRSDCDAAAGKPGTADLSKDEEVKDVGSEQPYVREFAHLYQNMQGRMFALELFLVAALGIALPISATQAQRNCLFSMLREGGRRYRIPAENASENVMSMALDSRLTYVSPWATAVIGIAPEGVIGAHHPDLVLSADRTALATVIEKLAMGATEGAQVSRFQSQDGQIRLMDTHLHLVIDPSSGKPEALRATAHDITERKAAEQRVADERRELPGLAFQDGLTSLFNRRYFDRELECQWQREAWTDKRGLVAVVVVDVEAYKSYNDH
jgi:PAS domain S-box-containing protein